MSNPFIAASALTMLLAVPAAAPEARPLGWEQAAARVQQQVVIHVPRITVTRTAIITRSAPKAPPPPPPVVERKANDCVKLQRIVGFAVNRGDSVELMLNDGTRLRARLGTNCPALDFYSGFYLKPHKDGKMCARRDIIRSRSGGSCSVQSFASLAPAR